jgi:hypothetical protein
MSNVSIIAIHGLGAHGEYTWTVKQPATSSSSDQKDSPRNHAVAVSTSNSIRRINWLREYLCEDFPHAQVMTFNHNADWFVLAPTVTAFETAGALLRDVKRWREKQKV